LSLFSLTQFNLGVAEDWLGWRGPDRTNRSPEQGLFDAWGDNGPELKWIAEGLGEGYASVSVAGDRVYTTGNFSDGQSTVAIDAANGQVVWRRTITSGVPQHSYEGSRSTPTIDDDRLYMVSSDGRIVCLRTTDGSEIWSRDFKDWDGELMSGWGFSESPLIDGNAVICTPGGKRGMLVALNKTSGTEIWAAALDQDLCDPGAADLNPGAGYASAVVSHGGGVKQYVQLIGRGLIGVRAADGQPLWCYSRVANRTANISTPLVDGDYVFASSGYNTGSALLKLAADSNGGVTATEVYWLDAKQLQNKHGGMTLVDGYVYCGHGNGSGMPICVELATGEIAWGPERAAGSGETSLVYADGHLVLRREDGTVILAKATPQKFVAVASFQPAYQAKESWAHPVIAGGNLYLREQTKLMCYRLR
jgi:hypothetical protein